MFKTIKKLETMEFFSFVVVMTVELAFFLLPAVPTPDHKAICETQPSFFLSLHIKLLFLEKDVNDSLLNEYNHLQLSIKGYYVNGAGQFSKWSGDLWGSLRSYAAGERGKCMKSNHPWYNLSFFTHFLHDRTMEFFRGYVPPDDTITLLLMK